MIDFIPLSSYEFFYNCLVGFLISLLAAYSFVNSNFAYRPATGLRILTFMFFVIVWLLLGLRPISYTFGDIVYLKASKEGAKRPIQMYYFIG